MEFSQEARTFERDGFVVIPNFLGREAFDELTTELDRYIRDVVPGLPATDAFYAEPDRPGSLKQLHRMACDPFFHAYRTHPRWRALAEALLGEPATADEPEWFNKPPGRNQPTPPHQDNFYFCLRPPHVATIWLALDRVDEGNGCLRYVRGSHRQGVRPHERTQVLGFSQGITDFGESDRRDEVAVTLAPGDAVAHHGETIHRAEANPAPDRHRRGFAMVWRGASCRRDEAAFARYRAAAEAQQREVAR